MPKPLSASLIIVVLVCAGCHANKTSVQKEASEAPVFEVQFADKDQRSRLLRGFYDGPEGWRWTQRRFALSVDAPQPLQRTFLTLDFTAPIELMNEVHEFTLTAYINATRVGREHYTKPGRKFLICDVPLALLKPTSNLVEFEMDKSFNDPGTHRDLGVIAVGASLNHDQNTLIGREAGTLLARQGYQRLLKQRNLQMPAEKQHELMKLFHDIPVWRHMWFQNVQIEKNPLDLWMMQQIIYDVQPEFIIETGTWHGGSALYWAHTLNGMGLEKSKVLTIDVQNLTANASRHFLWKKYVEFFQGSSTDPAIVAKISGRAKDHKTLVVLDSDHSASHVLQELRAYAPLVSSGSYIVVEDTHMDGVPTQPDFGPGPLAATRTFLETEGGAKNFAQDFTREALVMTFNPGGWLQRK